MYRPRDKAIAPDELTEVSLEDHDTLRECGKTNHEFWDQNEGDIAPLLKQFRREIKNHYWFVQGRRCCYCSKELDAHQGSYDAEHILPKVHFPQLMFEFINLAIGCKTCNGRKSNKAIHFGSNAIAEVPLNSDYYSIVHPHLDEWSEHLYFDQFGRITPIDGNAKGVATISTCGITFLNAARLADHFHPLYRKQAQKALEVLCGESTLRVKKKRLQLLTLLVEDHGLEKAAPILKLLEIEYQEAGGIW